MDLKRIQANLTTRIIGRPAGSINELWESIDSTNSRAKQLGESGSSEGVIILARQQTHGRGRLGRQWISPLDLGIYMSVLLRPKIQKACEIGLLSLACGVAVAGAIRQNLAIDIGLKWVNDLIIDARKVGGILAEFYSGDSPFVVLGLGLNIEIPQKSDLDELREKVISLEEVVSSPIDRDMLICAILEQLERVYNRILSGDYDSILCDWRAHSVTLGQEVVAQVGDKVIKGFALDIEDDGALLIQEERGIKHKLHAGDVQIRRLDGSYC